MKHLILTSVLCLTLTACETVSDMSMPSFGLWGDDEPVTEVVIDEQPMAPVAVDQNALQTELDEIEKLTGVRPQVKEDAPLMPAEDTQAVIAQNIPVSPQDEEAMTVEVEKPAMVAEPAEEIVVEQAPEPVIETSELVIEPVAVVGEETSAPMPVVTKNTIEAGCPAIIMVPATKSMTKFDTDNPSLMLARASIVDVRGGCEFVAGGMEVDLDILMRGTITNQGRFEGNKNQEAFVSFPYFITVMNAQGTPVNKQILATAMRFRPNVDFLDHAEKITQFIPMTESAKSKDYTISVGYQLSREQLGYNKAETAAKPNNTRVSPDTSPARRRSYNPLATQ